MFRMYIHINYCIRYTDSNIYTRFRLDEEEIKSMLPADAPESLVILALQCVNEDVSIRPTGDDVVDWLQDLYLGMSDDTIPLPTLRPSASLFPIENNYSIDSIDIPILSNESNLFTIRDVLRDGSNELLPFDDTTHTLSKHPKSSLYVNPLTILEGELIDQIPPESPRLTLQIPTPQSRRNSVGSPIRSVDKATQSDEYFPDNTPTATSTGNPPLIVDVTRLGQSNEGLIRELFATPQKSNQVSDTYILLVVP